MRYENARGQEMVTFSMKENIYFIVLWKASSSTACSPTERWLITTKGVNIQ
jgi:hypothetical protein